MPKGSDSRGTLASDFRKTRGAPVSSIVVAAGLAICCAVLVTWVADQDGWRTWVLRSSDWFVLRIAELHDWLVGPDSMDY